MKRSEEFLSKIYNESTRKSYENLFLKMRTLEDILNKDIDELSTKKEFLLLLDYCCGNSNTYNSVYSKWSLIRKYYQYIGNESINLITKKDLDNIIRKNKEYNDGRYISREYLIKEISKLKNYSDRAMILLMRNGIGAEVNARDLIELKIKDIDFKNNIIYNKKIDDYTMYNVKMTVKEKEYIAMGSYEKIIVYNPNSPYLFKTRTTVKTMDGMMCYNVSGFRGRLQKIRTELNNDNIVLSNLILSHVVDKVIEYQNEIGKELTQSELRYFLKDEFNFTKNVYDVRKMTRQIIKSNV